MQQYDLSVKEDWYGIKIAMGFRGGSCTIGIVYHPLCQR